MSDDGGSSGQLRASFGVLPPGDVRRSLVALSNAPEVMSFVMQYRFEAGDGLSGHSLGNLLITAMAERTGGMQSAVKALGDVLNVQGLVMCVTENATTLCAEFEDARVVRGESAIDRCLERPACLRVRRVWHEPDAETSVDVLAALFAADLVVIGPGDLYTSVLSALIVSGVADGVAPQPCHAPLRVQPDDQARRDRRLRRGRPRRRGRRCARRGRARPRARREHRAGSRRRADLRRAAPASRRRAERYARMREVTRAELIGADVGHRRAAGPARRAEASRRDRADRAARRRPSSENYPSLWRRTR